MGFKYQDNSLIKALDKLTTSGLVNPIDLLRLKYNEISSEYEIAAMMPANPGNLAPTLKPVTVTNRGDKQSFHFDTAKRRYSSFTIKSSNYSCQFSTEEIASIAQQLRVFHKFLLTLPANRSNEVLHYLLHRELLLAASQREALARSRLAADFRKFMTSSLNEAIEELRHQQL